MPKNTIIALLVIGVFVLVGCGASAEEIAQMTAAAATDTPMPTQTPPPTETPKEIVPVGTDLTTPLPSGNARTGEQLLQLSSSDGGPGCVSCHSLAEGVRFRGNGGSGGPSLYGIADRAGTTIEGYSAEKYLHESIVLPCEYIAEEEGPLCKMFRNYGERLDAQNLADLIAFLMEQSN